MATVQPLWIARLPSRSHHLGLGIRAGFPPSSWLFLPSVPETHRRCSSTPACCLPAFRYPLPVRAGGGGADQQCAAGVPPD